VTDAAVSIIALAVDPELGSEPPDTAESAGSEAPDAETRDSDLPETPEESDQGSATKGSELEQVSASAASDAEPLGWAVGALVALDALALPSPAPGVGLRVGLRPGPWRLYAGGIWFPSQTEPLAGGIGEAELSLWLGNVAGCYAVLEGQVESALCAESELGRLSARTTGVTAPGEGSSSWWAAGGGAELGWQVSPSWALLGRGSVLAPLTRKKFVVGGVGPVHQPPAVTVRAAVGVELRLP
jgi:hypothetical protein